MIPQTGKALGVNSELTYSQTEVIGLPEKASINYLASSKMLSGPGQEIDTYRYLAGTWPTRCSRSARSSWRTTAPGL